MSDDLAVNDAGRRPRSRLTVLYITALSCVALLSLGAQWLIQHQLSQGQGESLVINIAGRQRMLSQRLAKAALALGGENSKAAAEELRQTLEDWVLHHRGLVEGSAELGLEGDPSPAVAALYAEIQPAFERARDAAQQLVDSAPVADDQAVGAILESEKVFLAGMDRVVTQLVDEAEQRVARLRRLESAILALTLLVLLAEGFLIFRPAVAKIEMTLADLRDAGERLRLAKEEADRANAAKTRFLANVSHELRTPMTAVLGMTELALETEDDKQRRRQLQTVSEAGETLLALLNDLIDVAGIDAETLKLDPRPFSPAEVVERVGRMLGPSADKKGIAVSMSSNEAARSYVSGDARRLEQVLINLVSNAVKWTDAGRVTLHGEATPVDATQMRVTFTVTDTGPGVEAAEIPRLFEPFVQGVDESGRTRGGVGLGLAICRRIADAIGATIRMESQPGHGATVTVEGVYLLAERLADKPLAPTLDLGGRRLLVVEDTKVNQDLLRQLLERAGGEVEVCDGATVAMESDPLAYDALLIDLQLADGDGVSLAKSLRGLAEKSQAFPPKLVCITANPAALADAEVQEAFDAVLTKPIDRAKLFAALAIRDAGSVGPERDDELARVFLASLPGDVQLANESIASGSLDKARVVTHRLAGQVGYFGAPGLRELLLECEAACFARDEHAAAGIWKRCRPLLVGLADGLREDPQNATSGRIY